MQNPRTKKNNSNVKYYKIWSSSGSVHVPMLRKHVAHCTIRPPGHITRIQGADSTRIQVILQLDDGLKETYSYVREKREERRETCFSLSMSLAVPPTAGTVMGGGTAGSGLDGQSGAHPQSHLRDTAVCSPRSRRSRACPSSRRSPRAARPP